MEKISGKVNTGLQDIFWMIAYYTLVGFGRGLRLIVNVLYKWFVIPQQIIIDLPFKISFTISLQVIEIGINVYFVCMFIYVINVTRRQVPSLVQRSFYDLRLFAILPIFVGFYNLYQQTFMQFSILWFCLFISECVVIVGFCYYSLVNRTNGYENVPFRRVMSFAAVLICLRWIVHVRM